MVSKNIIYVYIYFMFIIYVSPMTVTPDATSREREEAIKTFEILNRQINIEDTIPKCETQYGIIHQKKNFIFSKVPIGRIVCLFGYLRTKDYVTLVVKERIIDNNDNVVDFLVEQKYNFKNELIDAVRVSRI